MTKRRAVDNSHLRTTTRGSVRNLETQVQFNFGLMIADNSMMAFAGFAPVGSLFVRISMLRSTLPKLLDLTLQHRRPTEWSPLFPFHEIEQELNRVACLCHFSSAVSVVIKRCGLDSTKLHLLSQSLNRPLASDSVHDSPRSGDDNDSAQPLFQFQSALIANSPLQSWLRSALVRSSSCMTVSTVR